MNDHPYAKDRFTERLEGRYGEQEIRHLWRIFYTTVTGKSALSYRSGKDLTQEQQKKLGNALERLAAGEPYQYVLGQMPFGPLDLIVRPGVLIPRPETEELIDIIRRQESPESVRGVLDIGTGSGCIALSMAYYFSEARVSALDISETALGIADDNARRNHLEVNFIRHDILNDDPAVLPKVDLLVSNPPYISRKETKEMSDSVLDHEPEEALFVGDEDPLVFYRRIETVAQDIMMPGGRIYLELNSRYARACADLYEQGGWEVKLMKDMSGNLRFLKARS